MRQSIWKFELSKHTLLNGAYTIKMPKGAEILSVQNQFDNICMWAKVSKTSSIEFRNFCAIPTGGEFPSGEGFNFLGTVQLGGGNFILHIFEQLKEKKSDPRNTPISGGWI